MTTNCTIRAFHAEDAAELLELFTNTVHTINPRDYTPVQIAAWAPRDRDTIAWQHSFENKHIFIAECDGMIAGFAELEDDGHIDRVYNHHDFQGKGVGKMLLNALETKARDLSIQRLYAEVSITARPFFAGLGFELEVEQTVERLGVQMTNFRMYKYLN
ncbi:MAG: GNAT family N-acetyltransferase [Pseudomonadota bacterium]